ncbi:MAG: polysaccharide deacetylase/methyltransferase/glycosyltransferase protein, partial [Hyphomicrobiales bacterium]|nr:polysaccharide deacetylase/methyltransferase/glycosyltransferase protein [Hyphomicrobiales bacterium]
FSNTIESFKRQLDVLKQLGVQSISSDQLVDATSRRSLPDRPVLISFDDGYLDFAAQAFPALHERGLTAEVFLVTNLVGQTSSWDSRISKPAPLMDWSQIRDLHQKGVRFGSHLASHAPVTHLTSAELLHEAFASRQAIEGQLGCPVTSAALPFGLYDDRVMPVLRQSGYRIAFSTVPGLAATGLECLRLPRLNVGSDMTLERFERMLSFA